MLRAHERHIKPRGRRSRNPHSERDHSVHRYRSILAILIAGSTADDEARFNSPSSMIKVTSSYRGPSASTPVDLNPNCKELQGSLFTLLEPSLTRYMCSARQTRKTATYLQPDIITTPLGARPVFVFIVERCGHSTSATRFNTVSSAFRFEPSPPMAGAVVIANSSRYAGPGQNF